MALELERELSQAEDYLRRAGMPYPVAWALGFYLDFEEKLIMALRIGGEDELARQVQLIAGEIREAHSDCQNPA